MFSLRAGLSSSGANSLSSPSMSEFLAYETDKARRLLFSSISAYHPLVDYSTGTPLVFCLSNASGVRALVRLVGERVQANDLPEADSQLFLQVVRRHNRYLPTFGDVPPSELVLEWALSTHVPQTKCLQAVYYPRSGTHLSAPTRLDIHTDSLFSVSLCDPSGADASANITRRFNAAIRG